MQGYDMEITMKKYILLSFALMSFLSLAHAEQRQTLVESQSLESDGFGGPTLSFTQVNDNATWAMGGKGAWLINHRFYLGGGGFNTFLAESDNDGLLQHEGVILGYIAQPNKVIHFTFEVLVGGGQLILDEQDGVDYVFAAEPQAYMSINVASFAVVNIGASYRYISGSNDSTLSDSTLSGAALNMNIMFGKF
jgi:hypothetical protein